MQCPSCGTTDPRVYFGFSKIECPNPRCLHHVSERPGGVALLEGTPALATVPAPATLPASPAWCPHAGDPVRLDHTAGPKYSDRPGIIWSVFSMKHTVGVELIVSLSSGKSVYLNVSLDRVIPWEPRAWESVVPRPGASFGSPGSGIVWRVRSVNGTLAVDVDHGTGGCHTWRTDQLLPEV